ncbi:unnamed protein product [Angiostrongylus costaricensis]|uniref:PHD-type domain-containing protein n=1 Tax=Angiostrongylus costaricensis TaxID=334426 RepID=A0A0R3PNE2_ANGCS|nr:unnamed protein product [Angiostrongylus costaricensis]
MLNQLRKKQLEKLKDSKVNAARKDGCRENQQKVPLTLAESEIASYYKSENDTARIAVRTEDLDPSVDDYWKEQDTLGSEDDLNANEFMDLFPVALPSPPRELLESLQEDAFLDDNHTTYEPHSKDCPQSPTMPGIFMDSFQSSPSQFPNVSLWDKKKRTGVSFANVNETTSLHGRTRKMTERAVELLQNHKDREKLKRKVDAVETEASEQWCFCREGSSGSMICCDDPECKYQWFHFECVGLTVEPKGQWFCSECSGKWH